MPIKQVVYGCYLKTAKIPRLLKNTSPPFKPENLYGRSSKVLISSSEDSAPSEYNHCNITEHTIAPGIILVFQDIYQEHIDYGNKPPELPCNLIAIQHCMRGRFEATYPDGEYVYMGPGSLSANLPAWSPSVNSFPLGHYYGFYIAISPETAKVSIEKAESVLGALNIDFDAISEKLTEKNRLAFFPVDEKLDFFLKSMYPSECNFQVAGLKLKVLELLQILSSIEICPSETKQYFPSQQIKTIKEIRSYLISNPDLHISLVTLSEKFSIPLTTMKNCFKAVYGMSIGKYIRQYRLQKGSEMLTSTTMRIIDIAGSLGYENASKFSEAFAKHYGMSPRDYRKFYCPEGVLRTPSE